MKKTFLAILLNFSLILSLTGCGAEVFDASGYTKACLDAVYHEEYEAYTTFVGCTIDEAKADMDEQSRLSVSNELSSLDITVTEEQANKYLILLKEIEDLAKYEIGQAEETENGFLVSVTVYPVTVYEQFLDGIDTVYQNAADNDSLSDETVFPLMIDYLEKCIENVQYKEALETSIQVTEDSEGIWQISEDEMYALDDLLLPGI